MSAIGKFSSFCFSLVIFHFVCFVDIGKSDSSSIVFLFRCCAVIKGIELISGDRDCG